MGLRVSTIRLGLKAMSWGFRHIVLLALVVLLSLVSTGCGRQIPVEEVSTMDLSKVAGKTIFFGHQSVGWNILSGIEDLQKAHPETSVKIVKADEAATVQGPALIHTEIGHNYDPLGKIQDFDRVMREGMGQRAEIALLKFCYVDFDKNTDVDQLFTTYKQTMAGLSSAYPKTTFVYVTAPLMAPEPGVKGFFKGLLGRTEELQANTKRNKFNELVRTEYVGKAAFFDLALLESTYPDGTACTMTVNNETVPCLVSEYTLDGGHLNEVGRQRLASKLLSFLATLP